jgi:hypothetical protein
MRTIIALAVVAIVSIAGCAADAAPPVGSTAPASPTEAEAHLLQGARLDLQTRCQPLRDPLPERALAGVDCHPDSDVVGRVRLYLFETQADLLDAYLAWAGAHAIPLGSAEGSCLPGGASEGAWLPGDGQPEVHPERTACYLDPTGLAHASLTLPPFVLTELDGAVGDAPAVDRFAWLGNQDQPGAPTIWRAEGPVSPEK